MTARSTLTATLLLVLVGTTGNAWAVPMFFDDRSAYEAAAGGGLSVEDFEADFAIAASVSFADFDVSETGSGVSNIVGQLRDFPTLGVNAAITSGTGGVVYDDNGSSVANFFNFSNPIEAFGIDLATSSAATVTVGGSVATSFATGAGTSHFFGVIDTAGLSTITFSASGGPNVGFDLASFGTVSVPIPGTLLLMCLGLAGLLGLKSRRS